MDPITALQVAGSIVSFVDFSTKLLSSTISLYKSANGVLAVNEELDLAVTQISAVATKLAHDGDIGVELEKLCEKTNAIAAELLARLESLKVKGRSRPWKSFQKAIQAAWSQDEINRLQQRIGTIRATLDTVILVSLRERVNLMSIQTSERFDHLDKQSQHILIALLESHNASTSITLEKVDHQTLAIMQMLSRMSNSKFNGHSCTHNTSAEQRRTKVQSPLSEPMIAQSTSDEERIRAVVNMQILNGCLRFPSMTSRYEQVGEAHADTFQWIFDISTQFNNPFSSFTKWLSSEGGPGLFWINGKAGSGKSTLMRYIVDDSRTMKYLKNWADAVSLPLCVATFFIWNSGTSDQKSQGGLLRTLLHQVCSQYPELIPILFPSAWSSAYFMVVAGYSPHPSWTSMSLVDLFKAFNILVTQTSIPLRLCFLIDGLDEFDGDYEQLCQLIKRLSSFQNVKVCISSRPWVLFSDEFTKFPNLKLQHLTHGDIRMYVRDKIENHAAFRTLANQNPIDTTELVSEITRRADGVFLWVSIVVKSLLNGFRNRDSIQDLQRRLRQFPKEIEPLYNHMFELIEDVYAESSSQIFQIIRASHYVHNLFADDLSISFNALELFFATHIDVDATSVSRYSESDLEACRHQMNIELTVRSAGLLETVKVEKPGTSARIEYLHRTAREFVELPTTWNKLLVHTAGTSFNPNAAILRSRVLRFALVDEIQGHSLFGVVAHHAMTLAHLADLETNEPHVLLLDQLDKSLSHLSRTLNTNHGRHWSLLLYSLKSMYGAGSFLTYAIQWDLAAYVREKLKSQGHLKVPGLETPLIDYIIRLDDKAFETSVEYQYKSSRSSVLSPRTGILLLSLGADPNERQSKGAPTIWEEVLRVLGQENTMEKTQRIEMQLTCLPLIEQFLTSGADPNACIKIGGVTVSALQIILSMDLGPSHTGAKAKLIHELERRGAKDYVSSAQKLKIWFRKKV